jgi:uncharacterized membrane protein YfcA
VTDPSSSPHGPERMPSDQPTPDPTDLANQEALQAGAASRWLVPAGVLAGVAIVLFVLALQLQIVLPVIGIVFAAAMWLVMFALSRRRSTPRRSNRLLAWLMGALAVGVLAVMLGIYALETVPDAFP